MSIRTVILAVLLGAATAAQATIVVSNVAATNVTTTSAWANATLVSTNGTTNAVTATLYYGTVDGTTNTSGVNGWANTNSYGAAAVGPLTVQATALTASHKYFYRWYVAEGTGTAWATPSTFLWTLSTSPTSTPTPSSIAVHAGTNGVLKAPTNFFMANSQQVAQAAIGGGALTNETDPIWTAAKSGYATGTPVYAETDPVWVAAKGAYDGATNALTGRMLALDAASTGAVAVLESATSALNSAVSIMLTGKLDAAAAATTYATTASVGAVASYTQTVAETAGYTQLVVDVSGYTQRVADVEAATNALDVRATALEGATGALNTAVGALNDATGALNTAVGSLQAATNALDVRVGVVESLPSATNWSAFSAGQMVQMDGHSITGIVAVLPWAGGGVALDEPFTNDVFSDGTWTNTVGVWGWSPYNMLLDATANCSASNKTATIVAGHDYRVQIYAKYGVDLDGSNNWLIFTCGGVDTVLTNTEHGLHVTTNYFTATTDGAPAISAAYNAGEYLVQVYSILLTDITPSNIVSVPLLSSDAITLGGETRTNWPQTNGLPDNILLTSNYAAAAYAELTNTVEVTSNAFVAADAVITGYVAAVSNIVSELNTNAVRLNASVTWYTNALDGTNGVYFVNPHNGSNYWILTP
jgi:uncharacterized protein YaiE (UPF0345 family)